jgi:hypothetical protein
MTYRFVVFTTPWWQCLAAGVPYLMGEGDDFVAMDPRYYQGPQLLGPGSGFTDVIMNPHTAPFLAPVWNTRAASTILYEAENLLAPNGWRARSELTRMAAPRCAWWNYSPANAKVFGDTPRPLRLELGARTLPSPGPKDLDVLFVGSLNDRRHDAVKALADAGFRVAIRTPQSGGCFGPELAALEARARCVLNVHYYTPGVFESFRVVPALARGAAVVSEASVDNEGEFPGVVTADFGSLTLAVGSVCGDPEVR